MRSSEFSIYSIEDDGITGQVMIATEFGYFRAMKCLAKSAIDTFTDDDSQFILFLSYFSSTNTGISPNVKVRSPSLLTDVVFVLKAVA